MSGKKQTVCTKPLQVKAWVDDNRNLWEFGKLL